MGASALQPLGETAEAGVMMGVATTHGASSRAATYGAENDKAACGKKYTLRYCTARKEQWGLRRKTKITKVTKVGTWSPRLVEEQ